MTAIAIAVSLAGWGILLVQQIAEAVWQYLSDGDDGSDVDVPPLNSVPFVTIQLPVYNEAAVVERLIDQCCALDYPRDRYEVHVLDDSTDRTTALIAGKVREHQARGVQIRHVRRPDRRGFKGGNLQHGLAFANGEFLAVFDADFSPDRQFLTRTLRYFADPEVGIVYPGLVRHLNRGRSFLTRSQDPSNGSGDELPAAQRLPERYFKGNYFNYFFGSPGVIRRACLESVGGWQDDTLVEDVDFSIRSYLAGWRCVFLAARLSTAEVLESIDGVKKQQVRWKKGNAECYRKHFLAVLRSRHRGVRERLALLGAMHVPFASIPGLTLVLLGSVPLLAVAHRGRLWDFLIAMLATITTMWLVGIALLGNRNLWGALLLHVGLLPRVSWGIVQGLAGITTAFARSPKVGSGAAVASGAEPVEVSPSIVAEALLALYFMAGIHLAFATRTYWLLPAHAVCVIAFGYVFIASVVESQQRRARGAAAASTEAAL